MMVANLIIDTEVKFIINKEIKWFFYCRREVCLKRTFTSYLWKNFIHHTLWTSSYFLLGAWSLGSSLYVHLLVHIYIQKKKKQCHKTRTPVPRYHTLINKDRTVNLSFGDENPTERDILWDLRGFQHAKSVSTQEQDNTNRTPGKA